MKRIINYIYIDGVEEATTNDTTTTETANTSPLYLGARNGAKPLRGTIDDLRIYNYAITDTELDTLTVNVVQNL